MDDVSMYRYAHMVHIHEFTHTLHNMHYHMHNLHNPDTRVVAHMHTVNIETLSIKSLHLKYLHIKILCREDIERGRYHRISTNTPHLAHMFYLENGAPH